MIRTTLILESHGVFERRLTSPLFGVQIAFDKYRVRHLRRYGATTMCRYEKSESSWLTHDDRDEDSERDRREAEIARAKKSN